MLPSTVPAAVAFNTVRVADTFAQSSLSRNGGFIVKTHAEQSNLEFVSRQKRRAGVKAILMRLSAIRSAEQRYLDNVPDNFQNSESFEVGENAVDILDEVIGLLTDAY